ncbi:MAG TPA: aminopeptidase, partial [bacterium]
ILRIPSPSMAQMAKMSSDAFEDFFFDVCTGVDWKRASKAMDPLVALMNKTDKVHIKGPGTDLRFSIKNIPAIKCDGHLNIPDLEVFTAPVRDSVEGVLQYNAPSSNRGFTFENVRFVFKKGQIVEASANNTKKLNEILDTDKGARYIGEFALGVHPVIKHAMDDILFDEKINGSFHFTPGNAYEDEADNGNRSAVHWDLVCIQRSEYGGGEIYFDGKLIRKNGRFVAKNLLGLNPEKLLVSK